MAETTDVPESESTEVDYVNDDKEGEYDDSNEETNKTSTKTSRMEVVLPPQPSKFKSIGDSSSTTPSKGTNLVRMPAVRSEIVPNGFRGKIEDKRPKQNQTLSKNGLNNDETKVDVEPNSYVTVTKSVSGSLDNAEQTPKDDKKFESTYYTKSSTCGYFTFSCNIVYGSKGRSKICRPKQPTDGKC